jgi:Trk K+ transport system NAD-binding subunit
VQDFSKLLHLAGDYQISELQVNRHDWLAEKTIAQLELSKEGILILGINRKDGTYLGAPDGETGVHANDVLTLYGRADVIRELDQRKAGVNGDMKHRAKIIQQLEIKSLEKKQDEN